MLVKGHRSERSSVAAIGVDVIRFGPTLEARPQPIVAAGTKDGIRVGQTQIAVKIDDRRQRTDDAFRQRIGGRDAVDNGD